MTRNLPLLAAHKLTGYYSTKITMDYYLAVRAEDFDSTGQVFAKMMEEAKM
ncbi:MAG: hypothetical protein ACIAQZ_04390 [Sedimentisphaeraceae bacterium JB056]